MLPPLLKSLNRATNEREKNEDSSGMNVQKEKDMMMKVEKSEKENLNSSETEPVSINSKNTDKAKKSLEYLKKEYCEYLLQHIKSEEESGKNFMF